MDFEVVIPSIKNTVRTTKSIPDGTPTHIISDGSINEARNSGVRRSESDIVVIMDDDIAFSEQSLYDIVDMVDKNSLVGMREETVGLIMGRVMAFHKQLWEETGGFDERLGSHNGDTDFAIKACKQGFKIKRFPQSVFDHEEHSRSVTALDWAWRLVYLSAKHPRWSPHLIDSIVLKPHLASVRFWEK
jgi:glycosyltransferase involved in cell wall biosynthesis